jgi:small-conductance mechanosensitive channel
MSNHSVKSKFHFWKKCLRTSVLCILAIALSLSFSSSQSAWGQSEFFNGIALFGIGALAILSAIGFDLIPLLAGAGIVGIAISFADQGLIKDVINGFLIILEDQYAVGDVIMVGELRGLVENMNLRITQIRNNEGQLITIPNSSIAIVRNLRFLGLMIYSNQAF